MRLTDHRPYGSPGRLLVFVVGGVLIPSCRVNRTPSVHGSPDNAVADSWDSSQRCPIIPLKLVVHTPDGVGDLYQSIMGAAKPLGHLDPRGCLVTSDGLDVEVTPKGTIWTRHELFDFRSSTLRMPTGRSLRISANGTVESFSEDGGMEPNTYGSFAFDGYSEQAACAARVLWVTFAIMMPSMAVSDGHPKELPRPQESSCPDLERPSPVK